MDIKRIFLVLFTCIFGSVAWKANGQVAVCSDVGQAASIFCSNTIDPYEAGTDEPLAPLGNNYDCLTTQPNPAWFVFTVAETGDVMFTLDNTNNEDIDFIVWGPFSTTIAAGAACGNLGNGGSGGSVADCSYSFVSQEEVNLPGVEAGDVYVMMVTNYSNSPTNIFASVESNSASIACECDLRVAYSEMPGLNEGVMTDTSGMEAEFVVCGPPNTQTLAFQVNLVAPTDDDTLSMTGFNLDAVFASAVVLSAEGADGRYDSLAIAIMLTPEEVNLGINEFSIEILRTDVFGSTCIELLPITVIVPSVDISASDTTICPGVSHILNLEAVATVPSNNQGTGSFQWVQVSGPSITPFSEPNIGTPTVTIPATTVDGDAYVYAVDYNDATGCIVRDTFTVYMESRFIPLSLVTDKNDICNNAELQALQFTGTILDQTGVSISSDGLYSWSNTTGLSDPSIPSPSVVISGMSSGDAQDYVLTYNYGTCVGKDSVTINFRDIESIVSAAEDELCFGEATQLLAELSDTISDCSEYNLYTIPFAPVSGSGTNLSFSGADEVSAALPLGFDFSFYCNSFSTIYVTTNGFISFEGNSSEFFNEPIPTVGTPNNFIGVAWDDLNPSNGGSVEYFTTGTAPNRQFIVNYNNVPHFGSSVFTITAQIVLHETTNYIDFHITEIMDDGGDITQGIENADGTNGVAIPGRNDTTFSATNESWRFEPEVYLPSYLWTSSSMPHNGSISNIGFPVVEPDNSTYYHVEVTDRGCVYKDSIYIEVLPSAGLPSIDCDNSILDTVQFTWQAVVDATSYEYSLDDGLTWISTNNTVVTLGDFGGVDSTVTILVRALNSNLTNACAVGVPASISCTSRNCDLEISAFASAVDTACTPTFLEGEITVRIDQGAGYFTYNYAGLFTTADSIQGGLASGSYLVTVTETQTACEAIATVEIPEAGAIVDIELVQTANISCDGLSLGALSVDTLAGNPATILWDHGAVDIGSLDNLEAGTYTAVAIDASGICRDEASLVIEATFNPNLDAYLGTAGIDSTTTFTGNPIILHAGSEDDLATYLWASSNGIDDTNDPSTFIVEETAGVYVYTVTATIDSCIFSDQVTLVVLDVNFDGFPTAFTPNGDGLNDYFRPVQLTGVSVKSFKIYNRWGQLLFDDPAFNNGLGWDGSYAGEEQSRDVYTYIFEYEFPGDAETRQNRGEFTLLR